MSRYRPEPVPTLESPTEIQRYLDQELTRISEVLNVKVDRSYGGMYQVPPPVTIPLPNTDPILFDPWTDQIPDRPDGVITDAAQGSIAVLTGGSYMVQFTTTVIDIIPNSSWTFALYVNGVATELGGTVEPSNQTEIVTVSFNALYNATRGDVFTVLIASPTSNDATVAGSEFMAHRVSETFD